MAVEQQILLDTINKKKYPFYFAAILFAASFIVMACIRLFGGAYENILLAGGAELLLYMISNAVCSMVVKHLGPYLKKTMLAYIANLACLIGSIYVLLGGKIAAFTVYFPIYSALVFCFFISISLISIIRKVISMLQES